MWYYLKNNEQTGPVEMEEVERLINAGEITPATMVWQEGMAEWQQAQATDLKSLLPADVPPAFTPPPAANMAAAASPLSIEANKLNQWFMIYWICLVAGAVLSIVFIGLAGIIAAVVFQCLILHKLWSMIPPEKAQTTPGKAVGFLFIPFFNFYWIFVAFLGLAKALNEELRGEAIADKEVSEGLCLTSCILACCSVIPYLGILVGLANMVVTIIAIKQMKDAGVALIEKQAA